MPFVNFTIARRTRLPDEVLVTRIAALLLFASLLAGCAATPGAEVRVGFDRADVTSVEARGYADPASRRRVTADDPVRVASISKLVVTLGVMRLVEAGALDLDRDVSDYLGWRLRNPSFPERPITLRQLLSHQSSLRDGIDYVLPLGTELQAALRDPKAWDDAHAPGGFFHYSNLNFPVVASVMERVSGERFDRLMQRLVLAPLGLDACFNWASCGDAAIDRAVVLTDSKGAVVRDDLKGEQPACPVTPAADGGCDLASWRPGANGALFSPQGGLRISARGLSVIGRLLLNDGMHGERRFLTPVSIAAMTTPQWRFDRGDGASNGAAEDGFYCAYGLGVQILAACPPGDDLVGDRRTRIGHAGEAYRLRSGLWIDRERGTGVAYFVTAVPDDAPTGRSAYTQAEERLAR